MIDITQTETDSSSSVSEAMTPMIDVIFSLIAFMMLMINAPLLTMQLDLPSTEIQGLAVQNDTKPITITILKEADQWQLDNDELLNKESLKQTLITLKDARHADNSKLNAILNIDKTTDVQRMIDTFAILQELKIDATQIALQSAG